MLVGVLHPLFDMRFLGGCLPARFVADQKELNAYGAQLLDVDVKPSPFRSFGIPHDYGRASRILARPDTVDVLQLWTAYVGVLSCDGYKRSCGIYFDPPRLGPRADNKNLRESAA